MRTGRVVAAAGAALVLVVAVLVLVLDRNDEGCVVTVGGQSVDLSADDAARDARTVARGGTVADLSVQAALTGRAKHALTCSLDANVAASSSRLTASGLTARAVAVRRDVDAAFGPQKVGGFAPGGVETGHMPGSAHYEGRAVDVFFRPINARSKVRGWAVAHYLVANADRLDVATVIYDGRIWSRWRSDQGWRTYSPDVSGKSRATARILEHRDHVHVDVSR